MSPPPPEGAAAMHLALYGDATELGGVEVNVGRVLGALPEWIHVTVLGVDESVVDWLALHRPGSDRLVLPAVRDRTDLVGMARHRANVRRLGADVVHFNLSSGSSCQWALLAACTIPGLPLVAMEHSSMGVWSRSSARLKRLTSSRLAAHVAVGRRTARLVETSAGLRPGSIGTIHHGVPEVAPAPVERPDGPALLNVARHDPVKGVDVLVEAIARVRHDVTVVQIGDGPETGRLHDLARRLGVHERIEFRGPAWGDVRAAAQMWAFDGFVLPSRVEGFPVTVVEAMLAGLPVIATEVGSVDEAVERDGTGWIVPPGDPDALAEAIDALVADPERARAMGRRGRELAADRFTLERTIESYVELYERVLGRPLRAG